MAQTHNLGFPRIGAARELKFALEAHWRGEAGEAALEAVAAGLRERHWRLQAAAGLEAVPVGDFSLYDHVLDTSVLLGNLPARHRDTSGLAGYFAAASAGPGGPALEMTKWFDTNYHYLVPEFGGDTEFSPHPEALYAQFEQARRSSIPARPVLLGPLSYLYLGKGDSPGPDRLALLPRLLPVYAEILAGLARRGATWVQMDEPCLALDWPEDWLAAFEAAYRVLADGPLRVFLASYFGNIARHAKRLARLPLAGLHLDLVRAPGQLEAFLGDWPDGRALSLGVIDGRNVWRADLRALLARLRPVHDRLGDRLWLAPSCSLLHVPVDLEREVGLDPEVRPWLAFAVQKLDELRALKTALDADEAAAGEVLDASDRAAEARACSARVCRLDVRARLAALGPGDERRASPYAERRARQGARRGCRLSRPPPSAPSRRPTRSAARGRPSRPAR